MPFSRVIAWLVALFETALLLVLGLTQFQRATTTHHRSFTRVLLPMR